MACEPPYCHGTGDGCGCNCKCCPPPCCDTLTYTYQCGSSIADFPTGGCDCEEEGSPMRIVNPFRFPTFSSEPISDDSDFVFALAAGCSVPCATVTVTVTTSGCCMEESETAIGGGTISASISGGPGGECGTLIATVNGDDDSSVVEDCTTFTIAVRKEGGTACCTCCRVAGPVCAVVHGETPFRVTNKNLFVKKTKTNVSGINKEALMQRMLNRKKALKQNKPNPPNLWL